MTDNISRVEGVMGVKVNFNPELSQDGVMSIYTATTKTGKYLFDVKVDHSTQEISILYPDTTEVLTKGKVVMRTDVTMEGVTTRPSSVSVKSYIYPRMARFLADYYVN